MTLSDPPEGAEKCESWDDVEEMVRQAVHLLTPEGLKPVQDHLKNFLVGVVTRARKKANDVYVSPPNYQ